MQDPKLTLKLLLADKWVAANTSDVTPTIHTGWYDQKASHPQVTVTNADEGVLAGGDTGYSGIKADGSGPTKLMRGTVDVNCWSTRDAASINPKQLVFEFSEEVKRIVLANVTGATDLIWISWLGRLDQPDPDVTPTVFRYLCQVAYGYYAAP